MASFCFPEKCITGIFTSVKTHQLRHSSGVKLFSQTNEDEVIYIALVTEFSLVLYEQSATLPLVHRNPSTNYVASTLTSAIIIHITCNSWSSLLFLLNSSLQRAENISKILFGTFTVLCIWNTQLKHSLVLQCEMWNSDT